MKTYSADIQKLQRNFLPNDFKITDWESLKTYFEELSTRDISSKVLLEKWLLDSSELQAVISEDACWRQIKMTCDTENKELEDAFTFFCMEIEPHIKPYADALNKKLMASPFLSELDKDVYYTYLRSVEKEIKLFKKSFLASFISSNPSNINNNFFLFISYNISS